MKLMLSFHLHHQNIVSLTKYYNNLIVIMYFKVFAAPGLRLVMEYVAQGLA